MSLVRTSSELSFVNCEGYNNPHFDSLDFWRYDVSQVQDGGENADLDLLYDCYFKILCRGTRTFPSYSIEAAIIEAYGDASIHKRDNEKSISYTTPDSLKLTYNKFLGFVEPWAGDIIDVEFDPEHPENERRLFVRMLDRFGRKIANYTYPQAPINSLLKNTQVGNFTAQRVDFLFMFPNGRGLIIEPGDHDSQGQKILDEARDDAFLDIGIKTIRLRNNEIDDDHTYEKISKELESIGAHEFLRNDESARSSHIKSEYLFLLPSMISRIEYALVDFLLGKKMLLRNMVRIGVIERDLACADWGLVSFIDRLNRLMQLYGIQINLPTIELVISRENEQPEIDKIIHRETKRLSPPGSKIVIINEPIGSTTVDLMLDVSIKSNSINKSRVSACKNVGIIRNAYKHNKDCRFSYISKPRSIVENDVTESLLVGFLKDLFRKEAFREGQLSIIKRILAQKNTIGLLPTSGGKSICYQLSSLLTPGVTIVIDPITALMQDQVESLQSTYRITRVFAWYAGQVAKDDDAGRIFPQNLMVFIAPERFLVPQFRTAMKGLAAADVYVNYAVCDEAHCVSMWGHEFRPPYLSLDRHIREYCTYKNRQPIIVALTGTASQLVLIDLKVELGITELDSIIRPNSFNRPELIFGIFKCPSNQKIALLNSEVVPWIEGRGRLGTNDLLGNGWGMIFTHYANGPTGIYNLMSHFVRNAGDFIRSGINSNFDDTQLQYGMYCGEQPKDLGISREEWGKYKRKILSAFKRGHTRMLVGNKSVGVGLDNEKLNWVINFAMPSSLEEYYQQCGRAGRSGQRSACALIYSDDNPEQTERWLQGEIATESVSRPNRWDDIGVVAGFHDTNFPGIDEEIKGARDVFKKIFELQESGRAVVSEYDDSTQKYISYWLILGVLTDYTREGVGANSRFTVNISNVVMGVIDKKTNEGSLETVILDSLFKYLSRYKPFRRIDIAEDVAKQSGSKFSERAIRYLVTFIYNEIEKQRKTSIRLMREYCNTTNSDSEQLSKILVSYFDRSPKFSDRLEVMAKSTPNYDYVHDIIKDIVTFEDVERLYWETGRLLAENLYQADLGSINFYSLLYRERNITDSALAKFREIIDSLHTDQKTTGEPARVYISKLLFDLARIDRLSEVASTEFVVEFIMDLYDRYKFAYIPKLQDLNIGNESEQFIQMCIANKQLSKLINVTSYERTIGKNK